HRALPRSRPRPDREIADAAADVLLEQVPVRLLVHPDPDVGVALVPARDRVRQDPDRDREEDRDLELAGLETERSARGRGRAVGGPYGRLRLRQERGAGGRQPDPAREPLDQVAAQLPLEPSDLLRERRLREIEAARRLREGAVLRQRDEALELAEIHSQKLSDVEQKRLCPMAEALLRIVGSGAGGSDKPRLGQRPRPRGVSPLLRDAVRDGAAPDAALPRRARAVAPGRRPAAPPVRAGHAGAEIPPPGVRRRRLRGGLPEGAGARALRRRVRDTDPGAPRRLDPDVRARPGGQPDRDRLARCEESRPLGREGDPSARGRRGAGRPCAHGNGLYRGAVTQALRLARLNRRHLPVLVVGGLVVFALAYVLFISVVPVNYGQGGWRTTTFGSAVHDPADFLKTVLDAITFAAALFIVASGFALIFGLMRVVNMAHGSFYLLAGYIAYEVQQGMTGQGFTLQSSEVSTWEWLVPLAVAAPCIAVVGLVTQQAFLRWNQGQELRQALITIAVSVIVADQIIAHFPRNTSTGQKFGGNAVDLTWPGWTDRFVNLHVA